MAIWTQSFQDSALGIFMDMHGYAILAYPTRDIPNPTRVNNPNISHLQV